MCNTYGAPVCFQLVQAEAGNAFYPMQTSIYPQGMWIAVGMPFPNQCAQNQCAPMQPEVFSAPPLEDDTQVNVSVATVQPQFEPDAQASSLTKRVWKLSRDGKGCHKVQQALAHAVSNDERVALASELRTHIWEAIKCPNANHVVQKCIEVLPPRDSQFIIDEIVGGGENAVARVARNRFGCRVLQRLLEHGLAKQVERLVDELLSDAMPLAVHIYGNYVMQNLLEHGTPDQISRLARLLAEKASTTCSWPIYGCAVLHKAFDHATPEDLRLLANAILGQPELMTAMATLRHGHSTLKAALRMGDAAQREAALQELMGQQQDLKTSRYGRALYKDLQTYSDQERSGHSCL